MHSHTFPVISYKPSGSGVAHTGIRRHRSTITPVLSQSHERVVNRREARGARREARGERQEARGKRREARGERREPRAESREPRAERQEVRGESREPRGERREARAERREPRAERREALGDNCYATYVIYMCRCEERRTVDRVHSAFPWTQ